jgi:holin-like protein
MLNALTLLLLLQLLGEALVVTLGLPVPGPVLGMALMLVLLGLRPTLLDLLKPTTTGLLQHLSLMFVPAGVGVMVHLQRLGDEALAIGVALVVSTLVGMASAAWAMLWLMRFAAPEEGPEVGPAEQSGDPRA